MTCWWVWSRALDKDGGGWFTKPWNRGVMALKALMELSVERTQAGQKRRKGWHTHTGEKKIKKDVEGERRKEGRGRASDHTGLIRFYRLTALKGWSRLLSSEMPGGVRSYVRRGWRSARVIECLHGPRPLLFCPLTEHGQCQIEIEIDWLPVNQPGKRMWTALIWCGVRLLWARGDSSEMGHDFTPDLVPKQDNYF